MYSEIQKQRGKISQARIWSARFWSKFNVFKLFIIMKLLDLLECITLFNRIGQNMQNPKFGQNPLRID